MRKKGEENIRELKIFKTRAVVNEKEYFGTNYYFRTIPKELIKKLGWIDGDEFVFKTGKNSLIIRKRKKGAKK